MKARPKNYLDIETMDEVYGIEVFRNGKWFNACEGDTPLLFSLEAARDAKLADIRARFSDKE